MKFQDLEAEANNLSCLFPAMYNLKLHKHEDKNGNLHSITFEGPNILPTRLYESNDKGRIHAFIEGMGKMIEVHRFLRERNEDTL